MTFCIGGNNSFPLSYWPVEYGNYPLNPATLKLIILFTLDAIQKRTKSCSWDDFLNIYSIMSMLGSRIPMARIVRLFSPLRVPEDTLWSKAILFKWGGLRMCLHGFCTSCVEIMTSLGWFELNWSRTWKKHGQSRDKFNINICNK